MKHSAVFVANDLHFDVSGPFNKAFDDDTSVTEGTFGFRRCLGERIGEL